MDVNLTRLSSSVTTNCYNLERQSFIFHSSLFLLSSKMSTKPKTFHIELMLKVGNISRCSKSILRTEIKWDQFLECSDTEDCEDLETDAPSQVDDIVDGCSPLPVDNAADTPEICVTGGAATESFVVIHSPDHGPGPVMRPGDGYTWSPQLVFRAKLTMHTAFERSDNTEPASVTSLAVSKDHKTLFVGDERGRVFSWGVGNKPGKGFVDHWVKDDTTDSCQDCRVR